MAAARARAGRQDAAINASSPVAAAQTSVSSASAWSLIGVRKWLNGGTSCSHRHTGVWVPRANTKAANAMPTSVPAPGRRRASATTTMHRHGEDRRSSEGCAARRFRR
jgi:hypothetical protein